MRLTHELLKGWGAEPRIYDVVPNDGLSLLEFIDHPKTSFFDILWILHQDGVMTADDLKGLLYQWAERRLAKEGRFDPNWELEEKERKLSEIRDLLK